MTKKQVRKLTLEYLRGNRLMTLSVSGRNRPWASTVFFAFDPKINLYFFSRPETKHCQIIKTNPRVAVAINQDWGSRGAIRGFQMAGRAAPVSSLEHRKAYALFRRRFPWADKIANHKLYKVEPKEVWHINQKAFGHFYRVKIL